MTNTKQFEIMSDLDLIKCMAEKQKQYPQMEEFSIIPLLSSNSKQTHRVNMRFLIEKANGSNRYFGMSILISVFEVEAFHVILNSELNKLFGEGGVFYDGK